MYSDFYDAMQEVLEGRRYDFLTGRRVSIGQRIGDMFERFLNWLFGRFNFTLPQSGVGAGNVIAIIFVIIGFIVVVVAGIVLARAILRSREPVEYDLQDIFEELAEHNYTVRDLLAISEMANTRRAAVRYRYVAAILALDESGVITIRASATNAVILRQIKKSAPGLEATFSRMAEIFHRAWFGHKEISDEDFAAFKEVVGGLVRPHLRKGVR